MTYDQAKKLIISKFGYRIMLTRNDVIKITNLTLNDLSDFISTGSGLNYIKNHGENGMILYPIIEISRYLSDPTTIGNEIRKKDMINLIHARYGNQLEFRKKDITEMTGMSYQTIDRQKNFGLNPKNKYRKKDRKVVFSIDTLANWMSNFIKTCNHE